MKLLSWFCPYHCQNSYEWVVGDEPRDLVSQPVLLDDSLKLLHHVLGSAAVLLGCGEVQEAGHAKRASCVAHEVMGALSARPTDKRHLHLTRDI